MNCEIICFASGKANENLSECEKQLCTLLGQFELAPPERTQSAAEEKLLTSAFKEAVSNNQIVFLCGDIEISKALICKVYHLKPQLSEEYRNLLIGRAYNMGEESLYFPEGSHVAFSRKTADSAFVLKVSSKTIFALPSNPVSLKEIIDNCIIPYFAKEKDIHLSRTNIKLFDADDTDLLSVISTIKSKYPVKILTNSSCGKITLEISSCAKSVEQADNACYAAICELQKTFKDNIYEIGNRSLVEVTVEAMRRNNITVSTAESCTGGMLSEAITCVPGASDVLEMGICAYSNKVKMNTLSVSEDILNTNGAVSKETAAAMAKGIRERSGSHIGVGITGVAGPNISEGKAVGIVYVAIFDGENYWIRLLNLPNTYERDEIREYATSTALDLIRRYIICLPSVLPGACNHENLTLLHSQPDVDLTVVQEAKSEIEEVKHQTEIPPTSNENEQTLTNDFYAEFIQDDFNTQENSDDSLEIAAENLFDDSGIILNNEYEPTFKKEKTKSSLVLKSIFAIIIALFLFFAVVVGNYFFKIYRDLSQINSAREIYSSLTKDEAFIKLSEQNSDFIGWINIGETEVNNPIYQGNDNIFYTKHNMKKQKSRYGALFLDYRSVVAGNNISKNIVIYGQNMDDGSMFGTLNDYQDLSFLNSNSQIKLSSSYGDDIFKVYAVIITNADKKDDDGKFFDYALPNFKNQSEFDSWLATLNSKNLYNTDLQVTFDDSFLTLVTTSDAFDNARLVVIAKKVTNNDSSATYKVNPSPVYPKAWYEKRNLKPQTGSIMTSTGDVSDLSSEESSSEASSSEESSSQQSSSTPSSRPNPSNPTPSTSSGSVPENSQTQSSQPESSGGESSSESSSSGESSENSSSGNESENTTTEQ